MLVLLKKNAKMYKAIISKSMQISLFMSDHLLLSINNKIQTKEYPYFV